MYIYTTSGIGRGGIPAPPLYKTLHNALRLEVDFVLIYALSNITLTSSLSFTLAASSA